MATDPDTVDRLARIETTLSQLVKALDKELPSYDARLTRVERVMWLALGMAAASGIPQIALLFGS